MTLALYGKSRRRQGGLLSLGVLAVLVAIIAGVATIQLAFAHHLEGTVKTPTCEDQSWQIRVRTGTWTDYREAVLTNSGTTAVSMAFEPFIYKGADRDIVNVSGTGAVNAVGNVKQYTGSWGSSRGIEAVNSSTTTIPVDSGANLNGYQVGDVVRIENELMKVTAVDNSGDNRDLTVTRGFGGTTAAAHSGSQNVTRWVRGGLDGSPNTISWNLNFDPASCTPPPPATCSEFGLAMVDKLQWNGSSYVLDDTGSFPGQQVTITNGTASGGNWSSTVPIGLVIVKAGSGPNSVKTYPSPAPPFFPPGTMAGAFDNTGLLNPGGQVPAVSHVEFCEGTAVLNTGKIIVKKVGPTIPGPLASSTDFGGTVTGPDNGTWTAKVGGVDATNDGIANGQYTVAETSGTGPVTGGKIELVGYKTGTSTTACTTTPGDYSLAAGTNQVTVNNNTQVVCVLNKFVADPTLSKVKASEGITPGGLAYWEVKVDNTANANDAVNVFIKDSGATLASVVSGGSCTGTDLGAGVPCTVNAGAVLILKVTKPAPSAQCTQGKINNLAQMWLGDNRPPKGADAQAGGSEATLYTIPGDPNLCDKPGITKVATSQTTQDPSDIKWTVTVTNPASGTGTAQTVWIKDSNVAVVSGPTFGGSATCAPNNATADFQTQLNDSDGVQCSMPNNSTITFVVKPAGTIARTCEDQKFNNTVYLYIGSTTNTPVTAQGEEITLEGDPTKCTRNLQVCKVVVGNGDGFIESGTFNFDIREAAAGPMIFNGVGGLLAGEPNPDTADADGTEVCVTKQVSITKAIEVVEWGSPARPAGWVGDATGYPMYAINSGSRVSNNTTSSIAAGSTDVKVTFYNKAQPRTREITIEKHFVNTGGYTAGAGDVPTFTLNDPGYPAVTFASACVPLANGLNNHLAWTCTVPYDWDGTVTETPADGWEKVTCEEPESFLSQAAGLVASITQFQTKELQRYWEFCNAPFGTVIVNKLNTSAAGPNFTATISGLPATDIFGGALNSSPSIAQGSPSNQTLVPLGNQAYSVSEVNAGTTQTCGSGATNYFTIVQAPADTVLDTPGEIQTWTIVNQPCGVLGQGGLVIAKYRDNNGDGTANGSDAYEAWTIKVTGPGGYDQTFVLTAAQMPFLVGPLAPGNYTVSELTQGGWKVIGLRVDNGALVAAATQTTVAVDGGTNVLRGVVFYNQPRVNIEVNKTEISLATPGGAPGNGWSFTLNGCGVGPLVQATGANGKATFTDLPPAVACSYTVTETVKAGWSAINPVQVTAPTAAGQTAVLNFTNVKIEVCTDCITIVTPTPTPVTPTATPTPETPTATPTEEPKEEPTEDVVSGEKTPGPGQTPIAPSTGTGFMGSGPGGVNMLFALVGLLAISLGSTILALGRKASRR